MQRYRRAKGPSALDIMFALFSQSIFDCSDYIQCRFRTESDNLAFGKAVIHGIEECVSVKGIGLIYSTVIDVGEVEAVVLDVVEKSAWGSNCCGRPLA
jgi:hypothetical protein